MNNMRNASDLMARLEAIADTIPEKKAEKAAAAIRNMLTL